MDGSLNSNDISKIVEADRAHVWHHLIQHKPFETIDPRIIVEGKGIKAHVAEVLEDKVSGLTAMVSALPDLDNEVIGDTLNQFTVPWKRL